MHKVEFFKTDSSGNMSVGNKLFNNAKVAKSFIQEIPENLRITIEEDLRNEDEILIDRSKIEKFINLKFEDLI
jgi:hypothetical protein